MARRKTIQEAATLLLVATMPLLEACSESHLVYEYSVDVYSLEWTPTDTLFFPIRVDKTATSFSPLESGMPYCLNLIVRYNRTYPAPVLPLHVCFDQDKTVCLDLGDSSHFSDGANWGSLCTKEFEIPRMLISFPDSGNYQIKVWPDSTVTDVVSITATME